MIELRALSKTYGKGKVPAVKSLSLTVGKGELFGFLGPNGAGKTTTIKMIAGLLRPDAGAVFLNGIDARREPLRAKSILGYCPDEPLLYERMSGARFLDFTADVYGVPGALRAARVRELAETFEVTDALGDLVATYSHGMRQKLSLVAALLHDPEVLVLDEPIVGLDPRAAFTLKETMRRLCAAGKTVFFSTHVMEVAERLCDRVGIISHGELLAAAPLEELRRKAGEQSATLEKLFLEMTDENPAAR
ncbi:MAG: ABC transporter ATP-binding protein [Spirochaetia bacterium]|jgi:ABC-2 type transport system ATP-binding protein